MDRSQDRSLYPGNVYNVTLTLSVVRTSCSGDFRVKKVSFCHRSSIGFKNVAIKIDPRFKELTSKKISPYLPVWLSWIAGIGLSAITSGVVWHWETTQLQEQFPKRANNLALALQQSIDEYLQVTRAVGAFYDSSERVDRDEFSRFSQVFLSREPGILELGWLEYVSGENRSSYEKDLQLEEPGFKIRDCDMSGQVTVAISRSEYYPTVYLETPNLDRQILGCDRAANPISRLSIDRAKTFKISMATQRFLSSDRERSIFEVYHPIYKLKPEDSPNVAAETKLQGLVYLLIDIQQAISSSVISLNLENLNFYLYDLSFDRLDSSLSKSLYQEESDFLLFYNSQKREFIKDIKLVPPLKTGTGNYCPYDRDGTTCVRTLNVADREWSVLIIPQKHTGRVASQAIAALTIGLFLTSLLATYLTNVIQHTLKTEAVNRSLNTELEITHKLHQMFLPKEHDLEGIDDLEIAGFMESATDVGGDYYDVIHQDGRLFIGIGDVTGHGLESGVLTIVVQTAIRTLIANHETNIQQILEALNRVIFSKVRRMNSDKILTLALLEYQDGNLRLSGQHEEAIVLRKEGQIERIDTIDLGFPIGLEKEIGRFVHSVLIKLNVGDALILYTDGIPEAENLQGKHYGIDRLCQVASFHVGKSAREIQQAIIADLKDYIGTQKIFDDITLLVLKQL
jgi:serine phosphatase RsbU (regulator of sigma subunit)/CHASE1-domain containing sensor protein